MNDDVLDAWRAYQADMRPETRNVFLRLMMDRYPPLPEHVPNPTDRIDPEGRVVYPDLTFGEAYDKGYVISTLDDKDGVMVRWYGRAYEDHFRPLGRVKP